MLPTLEGNFEHPIFFFTEYIYLTVGTYSSANVYNSKQDASD